MIKVCHISSAHPRYDVRIFIKECVSLAESKKYDVHLIIADGKGDELNQSVLIHDVGTNEKSRLNRMLYTPKRIYNKILELKPQIVHFHDPELMFIGIKLAKKGFKVIYDVHENLPKQVLSKYWIPVIFRKSIAFLVNRLELYTAKRVSGVVSVLDSIGDRFNQANKNIAIIHNYPLLKQSNMANQCDWNNKKNALVYVGGISKIRGIEPLIDALAINNLKLELAGAFSGDNDLETQLMNKPGWANVNYHGVINHNQSIDLISGAKIGIVTLFPVPSYEESLPIKMFEYMLSGIPIISTKIKLWEEIIGKYNCAIFVDPHNPQEIANACNWLFENDQIAKQMGENGRRAVLEHFNWTTEIGKLLLLYENIQNG